MTITHRPVPGDYRIVERENCFTGFYKLDRLHVQHRQFSGAMGPVLSRELFVRHEAVCVLPYDPQRDALVMIEQFRVGAIDRAESPWLLEMVAGLIDKDESPEEVARREAIEEAGLEIGELRPIARYFPSPGGSDELVHLYLGRCDSRGAGGIHGLEEEGEDIRVHVLSFDEAMRTLTDGTINNAACLIALQWLSLHRDEIRETWR